MEHQNYDDIDFQKYGLILKRHWLPAMGIWLLSVILATVFVVLKKPVYEANGKLLLKKQNTSSALVLEAGEKFGELNSLSDKNTPIDTEAEVIRSFPIVRATISSLKLKDDKGVLVKPEDFLKQLKVANIRGTDILLISYQSKDPKEAAIVIDKIMSLYTQQNISVNRTQAAAARDFITKQLPQTEATVRQLESILRDFKERNNVVDLAQEAKSAVESSADLNSQVVNADAQLRDVAAQSSELQSKLGMGLRDAIVVNSLSQSASVQQVLSELQQLEGQLAVQQTRYQPQHPIIVNLESKRAALRTLLQERVRQVAGSQQSPMANLQTSQLQQKLTQDLINLEVQRLGLASQVSALVRAQAVYQQRASNLPRLAQQQREIERQLEAAQSTYAILLRNLQQVQIAENQNVGNARIISPALVADRPIAPKKKIVVAAGFVVGGLLYVIVAFLLELSDPSIKTVKEVRDLLQYTPLGLIPVPRKKVVRVKSAWRVPELAVMTAPHSVVSEAYRMLQANLRFLSPDRELKVITLTSSVSREGKSTISANLALAIAQLGHRVLLIDADMHRPTQHHIWDLTNAIGLSDVVATHMEFEAAVRSVTDRLDVLPCGAIPPNPLALIDSKRFATLLENVSEHYDFVLLDTPPITLFADALTLSKMTDGVLVVARLGVIDTASATNAKELLTQSNQHVLGLVVNGVKPENRPKGYLKHVQAYYSKDLMTPELEPLKRKN